jgi:hypothetical protein
MSHLERHRIRERLSNLPDNVRLFRINAGSGWAGEIIKRTADRLVLKNPRPFHGAPNGWPDLAGWETIEITPDMVGSKIAVFLGEEVKVTGTLNKYQKMFRDCIENMGGIFRVLR